MPTHQELHESFGLDTIPDLAAWTAPYARLLAKGVEDVKFLTMLDDAPLMGVMAEKLATAIAASGGHDPREWECRLALQVVTKVIECSKNYDRRILAEYEADMRDNPWGNISPSYVEWFTDYLETAEPAADNEMAYAPILFVRRQQLLNALHGDTPLTEADRSLYFRALTVLRRWLVVAQY